MELPDWLTVPRPNGSAALRQTATEIRRWLAEHHIPCQTQTFTLRAYYNEALGLWLAATALLLLAAVVGRWGWPTLAVAGAMVTVGVAEVILAVPLVSWIGQTIGENIVVTFPASPEPRSAPRREIVLSAHYDTKTELLDHERRKLFTANLTPAMILCLLVGALGLLDSALSDGGSPWAGVTYPLGVVMALIVLAFALGMGLNLAAGRLLPQQSAGAVDDGASCAVLLELCRRLGAREVTLSETAVTVVFFCGEELTMQGSRAYVASRRWPLPTLSVNLECLGQDGGYALWLADGSVFTRRPTDLTLNAALQAAVQEVTGRAVQAIPFISSDTYPFLRRGIQAGGLASLDTRLGLTGLHGPLDNLQRVVSKRLAEVVQVLERLLANLDKGDADRPSR